MLQHDITNDKYYYNGVEVSEQEYTVLWLEWQANIPPPPPIDPDPEIGDDELLEILMGGAV